jgi:hypothetical protein
MPIRQTELLKYSTTARITKSLTAARAARRPTAFLSHSHQDAAMAKGLQAFLEAHDWEIYIDWEDTAMPATPDAETAERIQAKIEELDLFLLLATRNSTSSRWCPWELGYADGIKDRSTILIIPTRDSEGTRFGSHYLRLYRHIDVSEDDVLGHFGHDNRGYKLRGTMMPSVP